MLSVIIEEACTHRERRNRSGGRERGWRGIYLRTRVRKSRRRTRIGTRSSLIPNGRR